MLFELAELLVMAPKWGMEMGVGGQSRGESPGPGAAGCPWWCSVGERAADSGPTVVWAVGEKRPAAPWREPSRPAAGWSYGGGVCTLERLELDGCGWMRDCCCCFIMPE